MIRSAGMRRMHRTLGILQWFLGGVSATTGACLSADPLRTKQLLGTTAASYVAFSHEWAPLVVPLCILLVPVVMGFRKMIGGSRVWGLVHSVLDDLRGDLFGRSKDDRLHANRVTLFKYVKWAWCFRKWPWSGWLVPVERSGHTTRRTRSIFMAPDDGDRVEGVAGIAWSRGKQYYKEDLPDLSDNESDELLREYSRSCKLSPETVRKRKHLARSVHATTVEVKGCVWGVLVVDSRKPTLPMNKLQKDYRRVARFLGWALERL